MPLLDCSYRECEHLPEQLLSSHADANHSDAHTLVRAQDARRRRHQCQCATMFQEFTAR